MAEIKDVIPNAQVPQKRYVPDWHDLLPEDSLWTPGSHGDPSCQICYGTGWLRADVRPGHPQFGKLEPCSCVDNVTRQKIAYENSPDYRPTPKAAYN